ncbi:MAG TPA: hypothetical protein VGE13_01635 [Candidatus Saccharimonadales bacterium]
MRSKKQPSSSQHLQEGVIARNFRYALTFTVALFILAALYLGEWLNAYDNLWWWDDMLHGLSGVILGLIGLLAIYFFNARRSMALRPMFVAVFVFCFAVTVGVMWEIFEFAMDFFFKTTMQQWDMTSQAIVIGKDYQDMGLRDTMSDLILATVGSLIAAIISYIAYKHKRPAVLIAMRQTFPWIRRGNSSKKA